MFLFEAHNTYSCNQSNPIPIPKVYSVKEALGHKNLDSRGYMRDMINAAQGRESPGYLDKSMFWMTHHKITDMEGWDSKVMEGK